MKTLDAQEVNTSDEYEYLTQLKIEECKVYLCATDWYYARKMETGENPPEAVVLERINAREFIRTHTDKSISGIF